MKNRKAYIVIAAIIAALVLGVLIRQFGNVGIRRSAGEIGTLSTVDPLVAGVPTSVLWSAEDQTDRSVLLVLHAPDGEIELTSSRFASGRATATIPCSSGGQSGSLLLTELLSGRVLARSEVTILPTGPDCF